MKPKLQVAENKQAREAEMARKAQAIKEREEKARQLQIQQERAAQAQSRTNSKSPRYVVHSILSIHLVFSKPLELFCQTPKQWRNS